MANLPVASPISEADYESIESAVMETARGRWFLAEYARRNRNADTTMLLKALDRIEHAVRGTKSVEPVDRIRFDLVEMAKAISRTKAEIAAIKPDADQHGKFGEASEELDAIVQTTETATSDILACAEQIQEIAWTLREQGVAPEVCDLLDVKATEVYTACSFQDLTGQRTRKVVQVLRYLEGRINAMIGIWGLDGAMAAEAAETKRASEEQSLLNGPAKPGTGLDQTDVDMVMGPAAHADMSPAPKFSVPMVAEEAIVEAEFVEAEPVAPAAQPMAKELDARLAREPAPPLQPETIAPQPAPATTGPVARPALQNEALAPIMALSAEEKIALFS